MKTTAMILVLVLILLTFLNVQTVSAASGYLVTESEPVYPGDTTYIYVPIKNMGFGNFMEDVIVTLAPKEDDTSRAVTILDNVYSLGTISNWGDQRTAKFRIHVNPDTVEGEYFFNVYVSYKGQETSSGAPSALATTKMEDQILVIKGRPLIMLVNSSLGTLAPSSRNTEVLTFKNTGTGTVQNAVAEIDISGANSFSIIGGGKKFFLGTLKSGDEVSITFDLAVDVLARPGVFNIPVKITGEDNYSTDNVIGLVVAGTTDFDISYVETIGSFSLNVANIGISTASAVAVNIPRQKNFSVKGNSNSVLGNLNPGDYTSAPFQLTHNTGAGDSLEIEIEYTDTSGQRHKLPGSLKVDLSGTSAQSASGAGSTNYTTWTLAAAIVIIIYWQRAKVSAFLQKQKGGPRI